MLKAKEYAKSFKTFMSPEEYKKVNENGAFEQITAAMASEVGPQLVELFERLKNLQPFDGQERHLHPAGQSPQWTEYLSVSAHRRSVVRQ